MNSYLRMSSTVTITKRTLVAYSRTSTIVRTKATHVAMAYTVSSTSWRNRSRIKRWWKGSFQRLLRRWRLLLIIYTRRNTGSPRVNNALVIPCRAVSWARYITRGTIARSRIWRSGFRLSISSRGNLLRKTSAAWKKSSNGDLITP